MKKEYLIVGSIVGVIVIFGTKKMAIDLKTANENEKKLAPFIKAMEHKYTLPDGLLHSLLKQESAFKTNVITGKRRSSVGAMGIAQFMPATAKEELGSIDAALDPEKAIEGAARYLKKIFIWTKRRGWVDAVAAYNWGAGNVNEWRKGNKRLPSETQTYVKNILGVSIA